MKVVIIDGNERKLNNFLDWLLHMVGYTLVLVIASIIFSVIEINNEYYGLWAFLAAVIIYILNKTIKPLLIFLTLPITILTLGLFYPFVNVLILYITDFLLGQNFQIVDGNVFNLFLVAIVISLLNILMRELVIRPILERGGFDGSRFN